MKKNVLPILTVLSMLVSVLVVTPAIAAINFNDPGFTNTWNRVDKPVQDIPGVGRGYTWGPIVVGSDGTTTESYNGGTRKVQYFDKARMEVNNPNGNPNDLFYVTTGLLVKELVTGARQDGDATFVSSQPSTIQIAGDPNDGTANAISPTYASYKNIVTFFGNENGKPQALNSVINSKIDKAGNVSTFSPPEQRTIGGYDSLTQHNIADVFVTFGNQNGQIWNGSSFVQGAVFFGNPTYVLGRPVTDPLWTRAVVAGVERDVLTQLFERRVLTYTPTNPEGFKVEMGNVGQHYYKWRYQTPVTPPPPVAQPFPTDFSQFRAPYNKSGSKPQGNVNGITNNVRAYPFTSNSIYSSPAVNADQTIAVFGTDNKGVIALNLFSNLNDINQKWAYTTTSATPPVFRAAPMIYQGVVYIGDTTGNFYAINLADGVAKWSQPNASATGLEISGPAITDGTNLYFTAGTAGPGKLFAIKLSDGSPVWQSSPITNGIKGGPIFGYDSNIFFGALDNKVYAYTAGGVEVSTWVKPTLGGSIYNNLAYANNVLYVATGSGQFYALNNVGGIINTKSGLGGAINGAPAIVGNVAYFGINNGASSKVVGISIASGDFGTSKFSVDTGSIVDDSVAVVDGYIYFGAADKNFYQVELANSANKATLFTAGSAFNINSPVVANGRVYIGNLDGNFYIAK